MYNRQDDQPRPKNLYFLCTVDEVAWWEFKIMKNLGIIFHLSVLIESSDLNNNVNTVLYQLDAHKLFFELLRQESLKSYLNVYLVIMYTWFMWQPYSALWRSSRMWRRGLCSQICPLRKKSRQPQFAMAPWHLLSTVCIERKSNLGIIQPRCPELLEGKGRYK